MASCLLIIESYDDFLIIIWVIENLFVVGYLVFLLVGNISFPATLDIRLFIYSGLDAYSIAPVDWIVLLSLSPFCIF
jgi:hypothetical protein